MTLSPLIRLTTASPLVGTINGLAIVACRAVATLVALTPFAGVIALATVLVPLGALPLAEIVQSSMDH